MQQLTTNTLLRGGTYKIEKVLGQGSFGITYLAEHTALGKKVCIKEFFMKELNSRGDDGSITGLSDGSLSYNYAQKFRKEAQNLARMEHPNIVRVTDCFDENATFYYVMEYIEGQDLNTYIKQHALTEAEAVAIIKDVANALVYMHDEKHMLHLDLKPGNVMRRNSDGHIFLIDFGLSKNYDKNGAPETSTTIGLGTAGYAPIEQANQAKNGEFRPTIDVYALGATLYKLLTRETPPPASELVTDDELISEKLKEHNVSDAISSVVVNAMLPNVRKRTQSIKAFVDTLHSSSKNQSHVTNEKKPEDDEATLFTPEMQRAEEESRRKEAEEKVAKDKVGMKPVANGEETVYKNQHESISGFSIVANSSINNGNGIARFCSKIIWLSIIILIFDLVIALYSISFNDTLCVDIITGYDWLYYVLLSINTSSLNSLLLRNYVTILLAYSPFILIAISYSRALSRKRARVMCMFLFLLLALLPLGYCYIPTEAYQNSETNEWIQIYAPIMLEYGWSHGWVLFLCIGLVLLWGILNSKETICKIVLSSVFIPIVLSTIARILAENYPCNCIQYICWAAYFTSYLPLFTVVFDYYKRHKNYNQDA